MNILKKILYVSFSFMFSLSMVSSLLADGHGKCKHSKWGADDELGGANYLSEKRTKFGLLINKKIKDLSIEYKTINKENNN